MSLAQFNCLPLMEGDKLPSIFNVRQSSTREPLAIERDT